MTALNPTENLILRSACIDLKLENQKIIEELCENNEIDWNYFIERSLDTLLAPVIYRSFTQLSEETTCIPVEVMNGLRNIYHTVLRNNLCITGNFESLLSKLERENIKVIALKGMDVLHSLYDDFGIRQTSDIDLLFHKSQSNIVRELFLKEKFWCQYYMPLGAIKITNHPSPYKFYNQSVSYDIHVGLSKIYDKAQIPVDEIISRVKIAKSFPNSRFYILDANDNFVYLTQHLSEHFYSFDCKLVSFIDLVELIRKEKFQWNLVIERSVNWNCFETMSEMIYLISEYFGCEVPAFIISEVSDEKRNELRAIFVTLVREPRESLRRKYSYQGSTGFKSIRSLSIGGKFLYIAHRTFPDLNYLKSKYRSRYKSYLSLLFLHISSIVGIALHHFIKRLK